MLEHQIEAEVQRKSVIIEHYLTKHIPSDQASVRGIGMIWGIDVYHGEYSSAITKQCFENGLIIERAGRDNSVVKLMPALTISDQQLLDGLNIICNAVNSVLKQKI